MYCINNNINDDNELYKIIDQTKITCLQLGIKSIDPIQFEDMVNNPENSSYYNIYDTETNIEENNALSEDISIENLPYIIMFPQFLDDGSILRYDAIPIKKGSIWYNRKKYNELCEISEVDSTHKKI